MALKLPPYFPYPLAWLRLLVNLFALFIVALFITGAEEGGVMINHPFFRLVCIGLLGGVGYVCHFNCRKLLAKFGGVKNAHWQDSLWEAIFLVLVTLGAGLVSFLLFLTVYLNDLPRMVSESGGEVPKESIIFSVFYLVGAVYLYQLEHLIRHPEPPKTVVKPPRKKSPVMRKGKPEVRPLTRDEEIDQELNAMKIKADNERRYGK